MFEEVFVNEVSHYKRDHELVRHYIDNTAFYLHRKFNKPMARCREAVIREMKPGGRFEFKPPPVKYLEKDNTGDRVIRNSNIHEYLRTTVNSKNIIAPTFTTYVHPDQEVSVLSDFITDGKGRRKVAKNAMFKATTSVEKNFKNVEQTGHKNIINSVSGGHNTESTILFNATGHSTLTSGCRVTAAYGNANNEKFIMGNRHYYNDTVTMNNILALASSCDTELVKRTVERHALHLPTPEEAMEVVIYSSQYYWCDHERENKILAFLKTLSPYELANFVYTGDLYHLAKYNEDFVRNLLSTLSDYVIGDFADPVAIIKSAPDLYLNCAHQICYTDTKGKKKDYHKFTQAELQAVAGTVVHMDSVLSKHRDLIECFWKPRIMPASVAHLPTSKRKAVLGGDTDSTLFTVKYWVHWFCKKYSFDKRGRGIFAATVFLASATIKHLLAKMSGNFGVAEKHIFSIEMKSEYSFDYFVPTSLGKHYYAGISCQEGNVYDELDLEAKGVGLKSAAIPREIFNARTRTLKSIGDSVINGNKISLFEYMDMVAGFEKKISNSLRSGKIEYLRNTDIKDASGYKKDETESPYQHHIFWNKVFGPIYGEMDEPPYGTKKVKLLLDNRKKTEAWLASLTDSALRERFIEYLKETEKNNIGVMQIPNSVLTAHGIPYEIIPVIDVKSHVRDITRMLYIILDTLGYHALGDKSSKLLTM